MDKYHKEPRSGKITGYVEYLASKTRNGLQFYCFLRTFILFIIINLQ